MTRFHNHQLEWFCGTMLLSMAFLSLFWPETYRPVRFESVIGPFTTTQIVLFCGPLAAARLVAMFFRGNIYASGARIAGAFAGGILFTILMLAAVRFSFSTGVPLPGIPNYLLLAAAEFYSMNRAVAGLRLYGGLHRAS